MRARSVLLTLALLAGAAAAQADSWMPPQASLAVSRDGAWYLVITPDRGAEATYQLVRRRAAALPKTGSARVDRGDTALTRGPCRVPMHAWCLDAGAGFVLFDTYAQLGHGEVLTRHDGKGRKLWGLGLGDVFTREELSGLRHSVSSIWWSRARWLDASGEHVLVIYETSERVIPGDPLQGPNVGPERPYGVLRVRVSDGAHSRLGPEAMLGGLEQGEPAERRKVLDAVGRTRPAGWQGALVRLLADEEDDAALRVLAAVHLARAGDDQGRQVVVDAARSKEPVHARALALEHLDAFLDAEAALPLLQAALRDGQRETGLPIYRALQKQGAAILDDLIAMLAEGDAPRHYRGTAVQVLSALGAVARPALPALAKLAAGPDEDLAQQARAALQTIKAARP